MSAYSANNGPIILAHRGGAAEKPENSLEAFRHAVEAGCRYLETDVWLGKDGELWLSHDKPTAKTKRVTLNMLVEVFSKQYFAIDPKHAAVVEPLAKFITEHNLQDRVCIGASFDRRAQRVADRVEASSGKRPCTALVSAAASMNLLLGRRNLTRQRDALQATYIHVHKKLVSPRTIRIAHRYNLKLIAWTVNDQRTMRQFLDWGIDGFMTDFPSRAIKR